MGRLHFHDVQGWIDQYALSAFVETGLEHATSLMHAQKFEDFRTLVSIDINIRWINAAMRRGLHKDPRVTLLHGNSYDMLPDALELVEGQNVLWWLDAHFPEKYGDKKLDPNKSFVGDETFNQEHAFPVRKEMEVICEARDVSGDLFLLDDLRIYELGEYDGGNWKRRELYDDPGDSSFVEELIGETHEVVRSGNESGYVIATPK